MNTFNEQFKEAAKDLPVEEVCRILHISKFTYKRWINGDSAPHILGQKPALEALLA